jgi:3'-5' exoribonuclease
MFLPRSRFNPTEMFDDLMRLIETKVADAPLRRLTQSILSDNRERLLTLPAATRNHHAYLGGWLEPALR